MGPRWVPTAQSAHASKLFAPASGLNVPGGHIRHSAMAIWSPYDPGGQRMHCPAPSPERVPRSHTRHWSALVAFSMGKKYPGAHGVHLTLPSASAYDPVRQSVHTSAPGSAANVPAGQSWASSELLLPELGRYVPGSTGVHCTRPVSSAYVPGGQGAHSAVPSSSAYVPRGLVGHGTQSSAFFDPVNGR